MRVPAREDGGGPLRAYPDGRGRDHLGGRYVRGSAPLVQISDTASLVDVGPGGLIADQSCHFCFRFRSDAIEGRSPVCFGKGVVSTDLLRCLLRHIRSVEDLVDFLPENIEFLSDLSQA